MALTSTQKAQVRLYLGFSDQSRSTGGHQALEGAMLALSAEAETQVGTILTALATVDSNLTTAQSATRAGIIEVDNGGVKWSSDGMSAVNAIERAGRMYVARLAAILGVQPVRDVYGSSIPASGPCGRG
jgi:hypothetical protein